MRQLTGLDTSFLNMETATQFGHVASIAIFDVAGLAEGAFFNSLVKTVEERIHLLPLLRRRLVEVPLGHDHPWWIEDPDFDLEFHIRVLALPAPGTEEQLAEQVARLAARPLDRARPLWEMYVIEGIAGGKVGLMNKVHHCTIDGAQGVEMLTTLFDADPAGRMIEPPTEVWRSESVPSAASLLARAAGTLATNPRRAASLARRTTKAMIDTSRARGFKGLADLPTAAGLGQIPVLGELLTAGSRRSSGPRAEEFPILPNRPAPRTSFNKAITAHRKYAFRSLPLADARYVKTVFGTTINDVVMAISAAALRAYLLEHNELPLDPLIAMVPVSIRTGNEADAYSNRVTSILAPLHTQISDPVERLKAIGASMRAAKEMQQAVPADLLTDLAQFAPPALAARASRMVSRTGVANRMNPPFNVVISNVPGPNIPLYTAGATLEHFFPVSTIVDGQGMNITVQSYMGRLDFGVIGCREVFPDVWSLVDGLGAGLAELVAAAREEDAAHTTAAAIVAETLAAAAPEVARASRKNAPRKASARKGSARKASPRKAVAAAAPRRAAQTSKAASVTRPTIAKTVASAKPAKKLSAAPARATTTKAVPQKKAVPPKKEATPRKAASTPKMAVKAPVTSASAAAMAAAPAARRREAAMRAAAADSAEG